MTAYGVEIKTVRIIAQHSPKNKTSNVNCLKNRKALSKTLTNKLLHGGEQ
jgi:hypothetical protein